MDKLELYPFYAEVVWTWWEGSVRKTAHEANLVMAQSYAHAAGILEENYGDELEAIKRLECIGEESLAIPMPIAAGRLFKNAVLEYAKAEVIETKDYSAPEPREEEPQPAKVTVRVVKEDGPVEM